MDEGINGGSVGMNSIQVAVKFANSGRQIELDIARGLAVMFMIAVHTMMIFSNNQVKSSWLGTAVNFFGGPPAAPVFMFLLGVGFVYSRHSNQSALLRRGIHLFAGGYLMNILRASLPLYIGWIISGDPNRLLWSKTMLFAVDIFQFAGLACLFFYALTSITLNPTRLILLLIVGICSTLNSLLTRLQLQSTHLTAVTGLIWGSSEASFFPFLTWIIYPIAGYAFGAQLINAGDKHIFYRRVFALSSVSLLSFYFLITRVLELEVEFDDPFYYKHNIITGVVFLLFTLSWISILYALIPVIPQAVRNAVQRWSRNVTEIYVIHWLLLGWISIFPGVQNVELSLSLVIFTSVAVASDLISYCYVERNKRKRTTTNY
jgi:uncharacterized membrane protein